MLPPALIIARFFASEQTGIERLQAKQAAAAGELEEFVEEHRGEDGMLEDAVNDKGKVSKTGVKERLKAIHDDPESGDERQALKRCLALLDAEADAGKTAKQAQAALDEQVLARYAALTEAEIKTLAVEGKWFASIGEAIDGEVQRLTLALVGRIKELDERYAKPLPELEQEVESFSGKVAGHLEKMGLSP